MVGHDDRGHRLAYDGVARMTLRMDFICSATGVVISDGRRIKSSVVVLGALS